MQIRKLELRDFNIFLHDTATRIYFKMIKKAQNNTNLYNFNAVIDNLSVEKIQNVSSRMVSCSFPVQTKSHSVS